MDKSAVIIMLGRFLQALFGIVALRLLTTFLSPGEVGNVYLIMAFAAGFSFFLINPVGMYINRCLHSWQDEKSILKYFSLMNIYVALVSLLAILGVFVARYFLGVGSGMSFVFFALIVATYLYSNTWNMTLIPGLNLLGYRVIFVICSVATSFGALALSLLFILTISPSSLYWMMGQTGAMLLMAVIALVVLKKTSGENFNNFFKWFLSLNKKFFRSLISFSGPLAGATLFMWFQTQSYRILVEKLLGASFLGFLAVGLGIALSLSAVIESLIQQIYFPGFYKKISNGNPEEKRLAFAELIEKAMPIYIILLVFTVSLASHFTVVLVDNKFQSAAYFVAFGAIIEFLRSSANIFSASAHAEMRTKVLIKPYLFGGIFTFIAVYYACISNYKETLIPMAMIAGGLITFIGMKNVVSQLYPVTVNYKVMVKTILISSIFLFFLLFDNESGSLIFSLCILALAGVCFLVLAYVATFYFSKNDSLHLFLKKIKGKWVNEFGNFGGRY